MLDRKVSNLTRVGPNFCQSWQGLAELGRNVANIAPRIGPEPVWGITSACFCATPSGAHFGARLLRMQPEPNPMLPMYVLSSPPVSRLCRRHGTETSAAEFGSEAVSGVAERSGRARPETPKATPATKPESQNEDLDAKPLEPMFGWMLRPPKRSAFDGPPAANSVYFRHRSARGTVGACA